MAYVIEVWEYGDIIEINKYHSYRYGHEFCRREKNHKDTSEKQQQINDRQAVKKLRRQMIANFTDGDHHVVLTFRKEKRMTAEELKEKRVVQNFLRRMKKHYRKSGEEMKYIYAVEYKKRSIHIHMVITGTELKNYRQEWGRYGGVHVTPLYENHNYEGLAEYIVKETKKNMKTDGVTTRRWIGSTNLVTPESKKKILPYSSWRKEPVAKKGFYIDKESLIQGFHEVTGYKFQSYRQIRYEKKKKNHGG